MKVDEGQQSLKMFRENYAKVRKVQMSYLREMTTFPYQRNRQNLKTRR